MRRDDIRPGLGWEGVEHLQEFVAQGGVLLTVTDTSNFALSIGLADWREHRDAEKMKIVGAVVGTRLVDGASPIAYGYSEKVAAYCDNGPVFSLSSIAGERRRRHLGSRKRERPTGRGTEDDPISRWAGWESEAPEEPEAEVWENPTVTDEQENQVRA